LKQVTKWRIIVSGDAYTPPECTRFHLQGIAMWAALGEPDHITTSAIVGTEDNGRVMVTRSGSRYRLGEPLEGSMDLSAMVEKHPWTPLT